MSAKMPADHWLEIIRFFDGMRAYQTQANEAIHAIQNRLDDADRELQMKLDKFESTITAQMMFLGRNAEEAGSKIALHIESHKLRDKQSDERMLQLQQQRIQSRWDFWKVVVAAIVSVLGTLAVAALSGLLK